MDQEILKPRKPGNDHPWRNAIGSQQYKWAKEQSQIMPVNNVVTARDETLHRRTGAPSK